MQDTVIQPRGGQAEPPNDVAYDQTAPRMEKRKKKGRFDRT